MFEAVESIELEHEDEEAKRVAEKEDPTIIPKKKKRIMRVEEMVRKRKVKKRKGT